MVIDVDLFINLPFPNRVWFLGQGSQKVAPPGVPGKRADLLYVVIFCRLVLRDDYLVLRLA